MATPARPAVEHGNAYNIFVLVLTVMSLAIMVLLVLPINSATLDLLTFYDNLICVIFLIDFFVTLARAPSKSEYFFAQRGWLDLVGSIPSFRHEIFRFTALLRLARLSRLARIARLLQGQNKKQLVDDVVQHRAQYAGFITILLAVIVLATASVVVLNAESRSDEANITGGWDAFWWSFVTTTTVGYGDTYPVTVVGRIGAMFVMVMGIGIIGALASVLASLLVGSPAEEGDAEPVVKPPALEGELEAVKDELAALRRAIETMDRRLNAAASSGPTPPGDADARTRG